MSKTVEQLSKDLAQGMSRRRALWKFVIGIGAVGGLGLLASKKSSAGVALSPVQCFVCLEETYEACILFGGDEITCIFEAQGAYEFCLSNGICLKVPVRG